MNSFSKRFQNQLKSILGNDLLLEQEEIYCYSGDLKNSHIGPLAVALPDSHDKLADVLKAADQAGVGVFPRGAGTGLSINPQALHNCLVIAPLKLGRIGEIDPNKRTVKVQAGISIGKLNQEIKKEGLFFPPDPTSLMSSTIGGNIATNAKGLKSYRYGSTKRYISKLKIALASGQIVDFSCTRDSLFGLGSLFPGSWGTLGIILEAELKLMPLPEATHTEICFFNSLESAGLAAQSLINQGIASLSACEVLDTEIYRSIRKPLPQLPSLDEEKAALIIELEGAEVLLNNEIQALGHWAKTAQDRWTCTYDDLKDAIWNSRRFVHSAISGNGEGEVVTDNANLDTNNLGASLAIIQKTAHDYGLTVRIYGHGATGEIHLSWRFEKNEKSFDAYFRAREELKDRLISAGSRLSGQDKRGKLEKDLHTETPERILIKNIKKAFDPNGIMNPGRLL